MKRIFSLVIAFIMLLGLVACNKEAGDDTDPIPEPEVETEQKQDISAVVEQLKQISETLSRMQNCLESMCFVWGANTNKEA